MRIEINVDGITIKKDDSYIETKERIKRVTNNRNISDKEIIELLADEIEQYRNKIKNQKEYIKQLQYKQIKSKEIYSERNICSCGVDGGPKDYMVTRLYEDGILIKEKIEPV